MRGLSETLAVASHDGHLLVTVAFDNRGQHTVYVPKAVASEAELLGPLFEIRDTAGGEPLEYQGKMVKRGALTADDFVAIKAHAKRQHTFDIAQSYAFKPGLHTYKLSYEAIYLPQSRALAAQQRLAVEPVTFSYDAK